MFKLVPAIGLLVLVGVILLGLAVGGVVLVFRGVRAYRAARAARERVPATAYVQMAVGAVFLLPLAGWILQAMAWAFGFTLFQELVESI